MLCWRHSGGIIIWCVLCRWLGGGHIFDRYLPTPNNTPISSSYKVRPIYHDVTYRGMMLPPLWNTGILSTGASTGRYSPAPLTASRVSTSYQRLVVPEPDPSSAWPAGGKLFGGLVTIVVADAVAALPSYCRVHGHKKNTRANHSRLAPFAFIPYMVIPGTVPPTQQPVRGTARFAMVLDGQAR